MPKLSKPQLFEKVIQAIQDSGWNVLFIENSHPFLIRINNEEETYLVRIFIWNMTHGGGSARSADEYRIQITGVDRFFQRTGEKTLILGWWNEVEVFAGFDFTRHSGRLGSSPSMQIKEENLRRALLNGFSPYSRGNGEIAVAFRPDFIVDYICNLQGLHRIATTEQQTETVDAVVAGELAINSTEMSRLSQGRRTIVQTVTKKLRASAFKRRVLRAYNNRCAMSGIQLKLVEAAHILPVEIDGSTDDVSNGITLSALHHKAYDRGLITFDTSYRTYIKETEIANLRAIGFDGGETEFRGLIRPILDLPPATTDRPATGFINAANRLRGWRPADFR